MQDLTPFLGRHKDLRPYFDLLGEELAEEDAPALRWATPLGLTEERRTGAA
ncbi:hypothetical protein [Streptomyces sp. NPDC087294]|uniref:hypothetical protein n=1 Tax=Streptomyces sp. NPDC087294 TaxID=3365777 RepID=UPI0038300B51